MDGNTPHHLIPCCLLPFPLPLRLIDDLTWPFLVRLARLVLLPSSLHLLFFSSTGPFFRGCEVLTPNAPRASLLLLSCLVLSSQPSVSRSLFPANGSSPPSALTSRAAWPWTFHNHHHSTPESPKLKPIPIPKHDQTGLAHTPPLSSGPESLATLLCTGQVKPSFQSSFRQLLSAFFRQDPLNGRTTPILVSRTQRSAPRAADHTTLQQVPDR